VAIYESVPEWFFWFLVGSGRTGGLTGTGDDRLGRPGFFQDFLPWRVSWPVVGVRMRLGAEGLPNGKGGTRAARGIQGTEERGLTWNYSAIEIGR